MIRFILQIKPNEYPNKLYGIILLLLFQMQEIISFSKFTSIYPQLLLTLRLLRCSIVPSLTQPLPLCFFSRKPSVNF